MISLFLLGFPFLCLLCDFLSWNLSPSFPCLHVVFYEVLFLGGGRQWLVQVLTQRVTMKTQDEEGSRSQSLLPQRQRKYKNSQGYAPIAPESKRRCINTTESKDYAS